VLGAKGAGEDICAEDLSGGGEPNFHDVESPGDFPSEAVSDEALGEFGQFSLLGLSDALRGGAEVLTGARLHLHEDHLFALAGNDVYLSAAAPVVPLQEAIAPGRQQARGGFFGNPPQDEAT